MKLIAKLIVSLLVLLPLQVWAELSEQIKEDFSPLSGVIIMPVGDQYLVDLDAASGLTEGDILALTIPGEKVIHPISKEVLGSLDVVSGFLRVSQIKSGYSYAEKISNDISPQKGAQVKRFEQTPAQFKATEPAPLLEAELKSGLPHFNWLSAESDQPPLLTFNLNGNTLQVKNMDGVTIKSYQYDQASGQLTPATKPRYKQDTFSLQPASTEKKTVLNQAVDNILSSVGLSGEDKRLEAPGIIRRQDQNDKIWQSSNLNGNPVGLAVDDYDNDGQLETVVVLEDKIHVLRIINGKQKQVETVEISAGLNPLSIESTDLDKNGSPELYINANSGTDIRSFVVEFRGGRYQKTIDRIPWLLRKVDLPEQGTVMLGKYIDKTEFPFSMPAFKVIRTEDKLEKSENISTPKNDVFNFTYTNSKEGTPYYVYLSYSDYLYVADSDFSRLWESSVNFGGSEEFFHNQPEKPTEDRLPIYIQKRLIKLPNGVILAPQNEGSRIMQRYRNYGSSRIAALRWSGFTFDEVWRTSTQNGYLADFAVADADNDGQQELIMVIEYSSKNLFQKGHSSIVMYELNQ